MRPKKTKAGVIGVGHLGQHHAKHYEIRNDVTLVGVYDTNMDRAKEIAKHYNTKLFDRPQDLMKRCDGISIVTPTESHYSVAKMAIEDFNCHVFIEKPITAKILQADDLIQSAKIKNKLKKNKTTEIWNSLVLINSTW